MAEPPIPQTGREHADRERSENRVGKSEPPGRQTPPANAKKSRSERGRYSTSLKQVSSHKRDEHEPDHDVDRQHRLKHQGDGRCRDQSEMYQPPDDSAHRTTRPATVRFGVHLDLLGAATLAVSLFASSALRTSGITLVSVPIRWGGGWPGWAEFWTALDEDGKRTAH